MWSLFGGPVVGGLMLDGWTKNVPQASHAEPVIRLLKVQLNILYGEGGGQSFLWGCTILVIWGTGLILAKFSKTV